MDIEAIEMDKFQTYKSDWTYPHYIRRAYTPESPFKGRCVTFQAALKGTLLTGQCFGLIPVIGVCETDASKLRFTIKSFRFFYSILTILFQYGLIVMCFLKTFKDMDSSLGSNTSLIFYITTCIIAMIFLRIAMKWPSLCLHISKTEMSDPNMDYGLIKRCNLVCFTVLMLALCENLLSDLERISIAKDCNPQLNYFESFVTYSFPWIFNYLTYNHFYGLLIVYLNLQCTFNWNFADVFVICMSFYLTSRFEQVNQRIIAVRGKFVPCSFWRTMREDYNRLSNLVRTVDDIIGGVVFISFANNLFFICLQLLHTLATNAVVNVMFTYREGIKATPRCGFETDTDQRPLGGYEQALYLVYSFVFLMVRSLAVSLTAARIHTASKAPAVSLYDVSSSTYCVEIQRFLEQIHGDTVALSGLQFFNVKRGLVLAIAGTIVTYELVLMQFTGVTPTSATPN